MIYDIKHLDEKELGDFFLNPFERNAFFGKTLIQKYSVAGGIDDFICMDLYRNSLFRTGFILYDRQEVIVEESHYFNAKILNEAPFVRINTIKDDMHEKIAAKLKETNADGSDKIPVFIANLSDQRFLEITAGRVDLIDEFLKELPNLS